MRWQPDSDIRTARLRAQLLRRLRDHFAALDVMEVQTPTLLKSAVTDVHIDSLTAHAAALDADYFLRTSPEYPLKRLLAAGYPDIYEIGPVYRDGECGRRHQPEFTMLEWYRHGFNLDEIIADTLVVLGAALGIDSVLTEPPRSARYDDLLAEQLGCDSDAAVDVLRSKITGDFPTALNDNHDALLDWLFDSQVACRFADNQLTAVTHYPATKAALSRIDQDTGRALRFEIYCGALELANGFVELRDPAEQRARFDQDIAMRTQEGKRTYDIDEAFLSALQHGLPACAGVAVGIDRVMMRLIDSDTITDVVSFAHR